MLPVIHGGQCSQERKKRYSPLQTILDQIAAPPIKGSLVFPGIYGDAQTPIEKRKRVAMENRNIKKRVRRIVKSMGWEVQPSCTWCRHHGGTQRAHSGAVEGLDCIGEECLIANTLYS